ncbi:hypothetical protein JL721_9726 [Aureococcus anophagefferens]|nr:hypothetical protein JL721_9726 [Aureococcus anophagefferens]
MPLRVNTDTDLHAKLRGMTANLQKAHGTMLEVIGRPSPDKENAGDARPAAPATLFSPCVTTTAESTMRAPVVVETRKEEQPVVAEPEPAVAEEPEPVVVRPAVAVSPAPAPTVYRSGWSNADRAADSVKRHTYSADYKQGTLQFLPSADAPKVKLAPKKAKAAVEEEAKAAVEEKPAVVEAAAPAAEEETSVEEERAAAEAVEAEYEDEVLPVEYAEDEAPEPEYEDEVLPVEYAEDEAAAPEPEYEDEVLPVEYCAEDDEEDDDDEEEDDDDDELDEETLISTVVAGHETPAKARRPATGRGGRGGRGGLGQGRAAPVRRARRSAARRRRRRSARGGWAAAWTRPRRDGEERAHRRGAEDLASDGSRVLSDDEKEVFCDLMAKHDFGSDAAAPEDFPSPTHAFEFCGDVAALAKAPPAPVAADASDLFASLDAEEPILEERPEDVAAEAGDDAPRPSEETAASQQSLRLAVVKAIRTVAAEELESEVTQFHKETGLYRIDSKVVVADGSVVCMVVERDFADFGRCRDGLRGKLVEEPGGKALADALLGKVPKKRMKSLLKARARDFAKGAQKGEMKWQLKQRPKLDDWLATAVDLVVKIKQTDVVKRSKFSFCGGFDHYEIEDYPRASSRAPSSRASTRTRPSPQQQGSISALRYANAFLKEPTELVCG